MIVHDSGFPRIDFGVQWNIQDETNWVISELEFVHLPSALERMLELYLLPPLAAGLDAFNNLRENFVVTVSLALRDGEAPIWRSMMWQYWAVWVSNLD